MVDELHVSIIDDAPYVGPSPFEYEHRSIFFGRDREAEKLVSLITAHPITLLYAPSGAGKTSLINAKLIPMLRKEGFDVLLPARVQSQEPITIPPDSIRNIFIFNSILDWTKDGGVEQSDVAQKTLAECLAETVRPRGGAAGGDGHGEEPARVLIFDQMEEVFTLYPERWKDRQDFFRQIRDAISPRDKSRAGQGGAAVTSPLRVLFVMREDYIAGLDPYAHLLPEKVRTRFRLEHLRDESALDAIKLPLVGTKWSFAQDVAERLRDDLLKTPSTNPGGEWESAQFVEPVQLQVVCQNLWMGLVKEDKEVVTFDHLKKYGNVDEALLGFYERSVAHVVKKTQVSEGLVRAWFGRKLIRREGVRGIVYRGDKETAKLPNDAVDELAKLHLIKGELKGSSQWYELSHDRLITPIRQSNERWVLGFKALGETVRHLEDRADKWDKAGRPRRLHLDQGELHQAKRIFRSAGGASIVASPELDDLIDASKSAHSTRRNRLLKAALAASVALLLVMSFLVYLAINRNNAAIAYAYDAEQSANAARAAERAARAAEQVARDKEQEAENNLEALKKARDEERKALEAADVAKQRAVKALGAAKKAEGEAKAQKARAEAEAATANDARRTIESQQTQLVEAANLWKASAEDAKREKERAEALKTRAETLKNIADARHLKDISRETLPVDKELSLNLANLAVNKLNAISGEGLSPRLKARRGQLATEVERAFRDSIASFIGQHAVVRNVGGRRQDVAFSPDGRLFAALGSETRTDSAESQCTKTTPCVWDANGNFVKALKGHTDRVDAIAFSPDSTHIATEASDSTGRIWDVKSDNVITLAGLRGRVAALAFNSDGKLLITEAGPDRAVIWNASTGKQVSELKGIKSPIASLAFSPDDKLILVKSVDGSIVTWDAKTLLPLFQPVAAYRGDDYCLGFSPDSKTILATDPDRVLKLLDARTGSAVASFGNQSAIYSAAFDPSGRRIVTGGADGKVVVWDFVRDNSAREKDTLSGRADKDKSVAFGGVGKYMDNVRESSTLSGHTDRVNSVAFSGDGKYIISASDDKTAFIWDAQSHLLVRELTGHVKHVYRAVLSSGHVFTVGEDQTVRVWDYVAKDNVTALSGYNDGVNGAVFSPDGNYVAAAVQDGRIVISDANMGKIIATARGHSESVNSIAFSGDGKHLVSAGADGARVWAVDIVGGSLAEVARLQPTKGPDNAEIKSRQTGPVVTMGAAFSPGKESKYVVTADDDGVARIWEWRKGEKAQDRVLTEPVYCLPEKSCPPRAGAPPQAGAGRVSSSAPAGEGPPPENADSSVYSAAFSAADDRHADGQYVVTTHDGEVKVWEWGTAEGRNNPTVLLPASAEGKESDSAAITYEDASFSPDGRYVVAGGDDANAYVWEWHKGKGNVNPIVLQGHLDVVTSARFDNDGDLIVTAGADKTVRVWRWNSEERGEPIVLKGKYSAVFSPDDSRILTVSDDQTCLIYPDKYFAPFEELLARIPKSLRPLTREERDKYLDDDEDASRDDQGDKPPATP